jgi:hypothetical protein
MRLFAERQPVGIRWVAGIGPVVVGVRPLRRIRLAHGGVEHVMRIGRGVPIHGLLWSLALLCVHTSRVPLATVDKRRCPRLL